MEPIICSKCNNDKTPDRFVCLGRRESPALCKDCYYQMRAENKDVKARKKEYSQRPEVKERQRESNIRFRSKPGVKERLNEDGKMRRQTPEAKERARLKNIEYAKVPGFKERRIEYLKRPEVRQSIKQRREKPESKEWLKEYGKALRAKPGFKEREKEYAKNYYANPKIKERARNRVRSQIKQLDDRYVKLTLRLQSGKKIKSGDIPTDLVDLKRKLIELKRLLKQKNKEDEPDNLPDMQRRKVGW